MMLKTEILSHVIQKTENKDPRKTPDKPFLYIDVSSVSRKSLKIEETTKIIGKNAPSRARKPVKEGDIIFATVRPTLKRIAVIPKELDGQICSTGYFVFRPTAKVFNRYLFYYLLGEHFSSQMEKLQKGASYPAVNDSDVKSQKITYPSYEEQKRIVKILDKTFAEIDRAIENTEKNLANAQELFETCLNSIFFQNIKQAKKITVEALAKKEKGSIRTGPFGSQLLHSEFVEEGIAVLGIDNAVSNCFQWGKRRFITEEKYQDLLRYTVKPDDVIITIMGTCGRCAIVPQDIPTAINTKHLCCITLDKNKCLPEFLHIYFLHHPMAREFLAKQAKGSVMDGLNMGIIKKLPVDLPSLEVQQEIINSFAKINADTQELQDFYKKKLTSLEELKQSILQKAFSGELTADVIDTTTPEYAANLIAIAFDKHRKEKRELSFKHVKTQKILHFTESIAGIDLGRRPIKDAAGPNDFSHMLSATKWAESNEFFKFVDGKQGKDFVKLQKFDQFLSQSYETLKIEQDNLFKVIDLFIPLNAERAEVLATVHAAWNNLLLDGKKPSDEEIVYEARENWHTDKLKINRDKFFDAIKFIHKENIIPKGVGKRVDGQETLL